MKLRTTLSIATSLVALLAGGAYADTAVQDAQGNTWNIQSGQVYENGTPVGSTNNVINIVYDSGKVYEENMLYDWRYWDGNGWAETTIPTSVVVTGNIVKDAHGDIWTIGPGEQVLKNGKAVGATSEVIDLVYSNGAVYQENASHDWWSWNGTDWVPAAAPVTSIISIGVGNAPYKTGSTVSSNGSGTQDGSSDTWTIQNGQVYVNGSPAGITSHVTHIAYVDGRIYEKSSAGWAYWTGTGWIATTAPAETPSGN